MLVECQYSVDTLCGKFVSGGFHRELAETDGKKVSKAGTSLPACGFNIPVSVISLPQAGT